MIEIRKVSDSDLSELFELKVADNQIKYVGVISELLDDLPNTLHSHVILDGEAIIGFFNIDTAYSTNYEFTNENELGLRAFFIDVRKQGKGYGRLASQALKPYLSSKYRSYSSIALTVNCKNPNAYEAYVKGGFTDTGELFHGGKAGPQNIMRMTLNA